MCASLAIDIVFNCVYNTLLWIKLLGGQAMVPQYELMHFFNLAHKLFNLTSVSWVYVRRKPHTQVDLGTKWSESTNSLSCAALRADAGSEH